MKNLHVAVFTAISLAALATPAMACELQPAGEVSLPSAAGQSAPVVAGELARLAAGEDSFAGCSLDQLATSIMVANGWKEDTVLGSSPLVRAIRKVNLSAETLTPSAASLEAAAEIKPAIEAPKSTPVRVETRTVVERQVTDPTLLAKQRALENEQISLLAEIKLLKDRPGPLNADELAKLKHLLLKEEDVRRQITAIDNRLNQVESQLKSWWTPRWWWFIPVIGLLAGLIGAAFFPLLKKQRKLRADVNETRSRLREVRKSLNKHEVELECIRDQGGHSKDINFDFLEAAALTIIKPGETKTVTIVVDNQDDVKVRFTKLPNGQFLLAESKDRIVGHDPSIPIANPLKFVRRNYNKGMFNRLRLQSVEEAA